MNFNSPEAKKIFQEMGKRGGKARAELLSAARRKEIAAAGGRAAQKNRKARKKTGVE